MTTSEYQQLVEFLGRQFTEIDRRFVEMDRRFVEVGDRFTGLEQELGDLRRDMLGHFDELYRRLERLEQEYYAISQALRRIEALLADERTRRELVEHGLQDLREHVAALQARIEELERRARP